MSDKIHIGWNFHHGFSNHADALEEAENMSGITDIVTHSGREIKTETKVEPQNGGWVVLWRWVRS